MTTFKTQPTDLSVAGPAIQFDAHNEVWTIAPHVVVQSDASTGTVESSTFINIALVNKGDIFSANNIGVYFNYGGNEKVVNAVGASIAGYQYGVYLTIGNEIVVNHGAIFGYHSSGVHFNGNTGSLTNTGDIFGYGSGVDFRDNGGSVDNFGLIRS